MALAWIDLPDALEQHALDHPEEGMDRLLEVWQQRTADWPLPAPRETSGFYNRADVMRGDLADVARECLAESVWDAAPVVQTEWFCQVEYTSPFLEALLQDAVTRGDKQLRANGQVVNVGNIAHHVSLVWKAAQVGLHTNEKAREMSILVMSRAQRLVDIVNLINEFSRTANLRLRELWQGEEGDLAEALTRNVQSARAAAEVLYQLMAPIFLSGLLEKSLETRMFGRVMTRLFSKLKPGTPVEQDFIRRFIQQDAMNNLSHVVEYVASRRFDKDIWILSQAKLVRSVLSGDEKNFNFLMCVHLAVVALLSQNHDAPIVDDLLADGAAVIDDLPVCDHMTIGDQQRLAADIAEMRVLPVLADWRPFVDVRNNVQADVGELSLGWSTYRKALQSRCEDLLLSDLLTPAQRASLDEISTRLSDPEHLLPPELPEFDDIFSLVLRQLETYGELLAVAPPRDENTQSEDHPEEG